MFLAKPLRFRADLVCARSYAGRAPFFGAALFCALLTLRPGSTREFRRANPPCDPAAGLWTPLPAIPFLCLSLKSVSRKRSMFAWPAGSFRVSHLCCGRFVEGASRPARRARAGLGEEREPACHLRPQHVCLHLAHPSMHGTTCPPAARSVASHRDNESSPCAGRRASFSRTQHRLHEEVVGFMRCESYGKAIGPPARRCRFVGKTLRICVPRALDDGKMHAKYVSQRPTVAGLRPDAFLA